MVREELGVRPILLRERARLLTSLEIEHAERGGATDRRAQHGFDPACSHAVAIPEAQIEQSRRRHDRLPGRQRVRDDAARDRRADGLDLGGGEAVGNPQRRVPGALLVVVQLEIALASARHIDDEAERLLEQGLELILLAEVEEPAVEIALATDSGQLRVRRLLEHRGASELSTGR